MKVELKYPIAMYIKKQPFPFVYTFDEKKKMHKSSVDTVNSGRANGMKIIDADGFTYSVKKVQVIKYLGLWGFTLRYRGKSVYIDYEYEEDVGFISLENFKDDIIKRIHKAPGFWEEAYSDIKELTELITQAISYKEVMMLIH